MKEINPTSERIYYSKGDVNKGFLVSYLTHLTIED